MSISRGIGAVGTNWRLVVGSLYQMRGSEAVSINCGNRLVEEGVASGSKAPVTALVAVGSTTGCTNGGTYSD